MFCNCTKRMHWEERQGCHDKDDGKGHHTECDGVGLECSRTLWYVFLLRHDTCDSHLTNYRHKTSEDKHDAAGVILKPCVVAQSLESRTVVGCR